MEETKQAPTLSKPAAQLGSEIYSFSNMSSNGPQNLNAKKLDIDFGDDDDFFDSVGQSDMIQVSQPNTGGIKEKETESNPFAMASDA